jgi:hypothetical protein
LVSQPVPARCSKTLDCACGWAHQELAETAVWTAPNGYFESMQQQVAQVRLLAGSAVFSSAGGEGNLAATFESAA